MAKEIPMEFVRSSSHSIKFMHYPKVSVDKEQVFLEFASEWRGKFASMQVECSRYSLASGELTPWRVTPYRLAGEEHGLWEAFTPTARTRLYAVAKPLAEEWIKSDGYRTSEVKAIMYALRNTVEEQYYPDRITKLVADPTIQRKIGASCVGLAQRAIAARDAFYEALEAMK